MRIACAVSEKAPEITACDAITVAMAASTTIGSTPHEGKSRKNGLSMAAGFASTSAPCPK
ncbi:hypothetical protein D3C87_976150 [compost metagenome]